MAFPGSNGGERLPYNFFRGDRQSGSSGDKKKKRKKAVSAACIA